MKKMTLIRSIATVALFMVASKMMAQTNPQLVTLPTYNILTDSSYVSPDYATVGAQMPYFVNRDPYFRTHSSMFKPSGFAWSNTGGLTFNTLAGGILSPLEGVLYADTMVRLTYAAAGTVNISVYEQSRPKNGIGCPGNSRTLNVTVYAKPNMQLHTAGDDTTGGCTAGSYYPIAYDFLTIAAVSDSVYIGYTLTAYDLNGAATGTPTNYTAKIATTDSLRIYPSQMATAAAVSPAPAPAGSYKVTLTKLWDEVSVRALNRDDATFYTDPAASNDYVIMLYPTPATAPIKHIRKL